MTVLGFRTSNDTDFAKFEKRLKNPLPQWSWNQAGMKYFFSKLELFVGDRLAFREDLLQLNADLNLIMGRSSNPDKVIIGKQGWLFLGNGFNETINQYRGITRLNEKQLKSLKAYFSDIQDFTKSRNIEFLILIPPEKHAIYPEFLPDYLAQKGISPLDQLMKNKGNLNIIELSKPYYKSKTCSKTLLFYKTDTHWNQYGGYLGYNEFMNRLPERFTKDHIFLYATDFKTITCLVDRDLPILLKGGFKFPETEPICTKNLGTTKLKIKNITTNSDWVDLNPNVCVDIFKRPVVKNAQKKGKLLLFGDSFSNYLSNYLNNSFNEVIYVNYLKTDSLILSSILEQYKPDVFLFEMVERNLLNPINMLIPLSKKISSIPFLKFHNKSVISGSDFNSQITNVTLGEDGIHFKVLDSDPNFILPKSNYPQNQVIVKLIKTVPKQTTVQLFYLTDSSKDYSEAQSVRQKVLAGKQTIYLTIHDAGLLGRLRIDPGKDAGDYIIHEIELRE